MAACEAWGGDMVAARDEAPAGDHVGAVHNLLEHYDAMLAHYGTEPGLRMARKHLGWYARGFPGAAEFRGRVVTLPDPNAVRDAIRNAWTALAAQPQQKAA